MSQLNSVTSTSVQVSILLSSFLRCGTEVHLLTQLTKYKLNIAKGRTLDVHTPERTVAAHTTQSATGTNLAYKQIKRKQSTKFQTVFSYVEVFTGSHLNTS